MKGTGAMTHFKQFDLNTINIRLQHVTFDVWKKQFNISKTYAARFLERRKYSLFWFNQSETCFLIDG